MGSTEYPCPSVSGPPEAAERALQQCANSSVDMALFALMLCTLLLCSALALLWVLHSMSVHYP